MPRQQATVAMGNVVLSPALPSELLTHIIECCSHPTTLVVCASRDAFITAFLAEGRGDKAALQQQQQHPRARERRARLVQSPASLLQIAVSRHIRVSFVPTVVHLRAYLAAFNPNTSRVGPPPEIESSGSSGDGSDRSGSRQKPSLFIYGFLQLHRDTSEWSAQGLAASAAALVETAGRAGFDALIVDNRRHLPGGLNTTARGSSSYGYEERVPILSTVPRRQLQKAGYPLYTKRLKAVLGRWFRFAPGAWDEDNKDDDRHDRQQRPERPQKPQRPPRDYIPDSEDDESSSLGDAQDAVVAVE